MERVVLAYSGGLDTSVSIKWLQERGYEVIALTVDVGQGSRLIEIKEKALKVGAAKCLVLDGRHDLAYNYVLPALKANALYGGQYPLSSALSRPLISKLLVKAAHQEGATAVAHGCTGKGNDQVRFDVSVAALDPGLEIVAPVREWHWSREEQIDYAAENGIPVPVGKESPYSIDMNLWGRSIECGVLEDPWAEPPPDVFELTTDPQQAPNTPLEVTVEFEEGLPVALDGEQLGLVELIEKLNTVAGQHGVGRIDMLEDRLVGIKSREIYEAPAAVVLTCAHRDLERAVLPRETAQLKPQLEQKYAELTYFGLWYSQLKQALDAFFDETQQTVTGSVRLKLFKGSVQVVGRSSPASLYDYGLATYDDTDQFDHGASEGFISIWGLPTRVYAGVNGSADDSNGPETQKPTSKSVADTSSTRISSTNDN